ncbi:MAG: Lipid A core - O-antigen ligase [Candidatus Accumulibacter adjunctus]|uniref:Lipid A core-O-antigen ligase n=1 Tax=Candidatus Accumulibacter adjunctus TaxID=1454001 RepID=A0A011ME32_9PROT|nr:MAG: Lipid A core - O-antigen ligase [Candidatus Accumulibacter adjunctus]
MILLHGALAILSGALAASIALSHPLWPASLALALLVWCVVVCLSPVVWLAVLPAVLPLAGFSPWTGWIGVEEFDLFCLGAAAGSLSRLVLQRLWPARWLRAAERNAGGFGDERLAGGILSLPAASLPRLPLSPDCRRRLAGCALALLAASSLAAVWRGMIAAGGPPVDWFEGYEDPLNCLRVAKSLFLVLLLLPSLCHLLRCQPRSSMRCLAAGTVAGLAVVALAALWERLAHPGLLDFTTAYRTTALFWEMHVGGAALDAFLALTLPFAVRPVLRAVAPGSWLAAALLAVLACYACLTSFSRALYLGVAVAVAVLVCSHVRQAAMAGSAGSGRRRLPRWQQRANRVLAGILLAEVLLVAGIGEFMSSRLASGERDFVGRLTHWQEGLGLLQDGSDILFGRGSGRFPADYSAQVAGREMPGRLHLMDEAEGRHLGLQGAHWLAPQRGRWELLQRVPAPLAGSYRLRLAVRSLQPAVLVASVCHQHLLYAAACAESTVFSPGGGGQWREFELSLHGSAGLPASRQLPVPGFFSLRLLGPAGFVEIDALSLIDGNGSQLLANGDFSQGLAGWFFAARHYFLPWHVDSLYLEMLIDQGVIGLSLLLVLVVLAIVNLCGLCRRQHELAPYLLAALLACMATGVFVSVLDMPRVAFLFYLFLCCALFVNERPLASVPSPAGSDKAPELLCRV